MRMHKAALRILAAFALLILGTLATGLLQTNNSSQLSTAATSIVAGVAHADAASTCSAAGNDNQNKACQAGYNGFVGTPTSEKTEICSGYKDSKDLTQYCGIGFDAAQQEVQGGDGASALSQVGSVCSAAGDSKSANYKACAAGYTGLLKDPKASQSTLCKPYKSSKEQTQYCEVGFKAAQDAQGSIADATNPDEPASGFDQDKCATSAGGFSWVACPLLDSITNFFATTASSLLQQFMAVQPLQQTGPIYETWSAIKLIANICFLLIFLTIAFATTVQHNTDAYSIKRMVPRLAAAAILVQFSFVLSSALIDVGNILGSGVGSLFKLVVDTGSPVASRDAIGTIIENALAGVGVAAAMSLIASSMILASPLLIIAGIAVLTVVAILGFRYFLIGVLIVVSPLALVAFVLPGTEQYFNKWLKMFTRLIVMYPLIVLLLGVAGSVSSLVPVAANAASTSGQVGQTIAVTVIKILIVVGCFSQIPKTFQWAGGLMSEASGEISGMGRKLAKSKWNSVGTETARKQAFNNRLDKANNIREGLQKGEGKYRWLHVGGDGAVATKMRSGLVSPATNLLAGVSADRASLHYDYGKIVSEHKDTISKLPSGKDTNLLESALMVHYARQNMNNSNLTQAQRNSARDMATSRYQNLKLADAEYLMDYTGTSARREAIMSTLAETKQLKQPLLQSVQQTGDKQELMALTRNGFKNYGSEMFLWGINSENEFKPQVAPTLRAFKASALAGDFSDRNFEVAASVGTDRAVIQSRKAAELIAENLSAESLRANFKHGDRDKFSRNKQLQMFMIMARNQDLYNSGPGLQQRTSIINQVMSDMKSTNGESHKELLADLQATAIRDGENPEQYLAFFNNTPRGSGTGSYRFEWPPETPPAIPPPDQLED